jgi:hypothetical protein
VWWTASAPTAPYSWSAWSYAYERMATSLAWSSKCTFGTGRPCWSFTSALRVTRLPGCGTPSRAGAVGRTPTGTTQTNSPRFLLRYARSAEFWVAAIAASYASFASTLRLSLRRRSARVACHAW